MEASKDFRKPAIGSDEAPAYKDGGISILDSVYNYGRGQDELSENIPFTSLLNVRLFNSSGR